LNPLLTYRTTTQAPPLKQHYQAPNDLHHELFPETFDFHLETIHDILFMIPINPEEAARPRNDGGPDPNLKTDFQLYPRMPRYSTKDIVVVKEYKMGMAREVKVGSEIMLCKVFTNSLGNEHLTQEFIALQNIDKANAKLKVPLRIPLLKGYIVHPVTGAILGFLRSWIPPSQYRNSIQDAGKRMSSITVEIRRKWFQQVTETIDGLHSVGLVWGDAKAANVCIDPDNNAWLIDFVGAWT
jgi:hypothetical protein